MVTSLSSPGVEVREIDLTGIVPSVSTTEGVIAGVFHWGPVDERVLIENEKQLVTRFEKPSNFNAETFFTAASFLAYGNKLYVTRVANTAGRSPSANVVVESGNTTLLLGTGDTANLEVGMVSISTANGGLTVGATIASIVNTTAFTISNGGDATANSTESVQWQSDTSFSAVGNTWNDFAFLSSTTPILTSLLMVESKSLSSDLRRIIMSCGIAIRFLCIAL